MWICVDLPRIELHGPAEPIHDAEQLKEWVWEHHRETLLERMTVSSSVSNLCTLEKARKRLDQLDTISTVHRLFLQNEPLDVVFETLLEGLLTLAESECGLIGELRNDERGRQYLHLHARTNANVPVTAEEERYMQQSHGRFYNMDNLFGAVLKSKSVVLSNDPSTDPRSKGFPPGHPFLRHFLGVPFFDQRGAAIGMVGIANKPGGFSQHDVEMLEPFCLTCSNIIQAYQQIERNEHLINTLEIKFAERTQKLERANLELEAANRRVVQASEAQLQHFACMSHEIRTPLNCIIGLSSLLQDACENLNHVQRESVNMIVSSSNLLLSVVNDVLDYSKLESGNTEMDIKRHNLQETLNAVVHSIDLKAQSKRIRLKTQYDCLVPEYIHTDSRRLQQILYNLLGNAIKFSPEGGVIELGVLLVPAPPVEAAYSVSPGSNEAGENWQQEKNKDVTDSFALRFVVKDYGKGIKQEDFKRIFEPFRQASAETESVYGGTGLGLAITSKLVRGLGGSISVDSQVEAWTRFTVDLPFVNNAPENVMETAARLADTTLLWVGGSGEDDDAHSESMLRVFREYKLRYRVFPSCDAMKGFVDTKEMHPHNHEDRPQQDGASRNSSRVRNALRRGKGRSFLCLVREDLYQDDCLQGVAWPNFEERAVLLTYGPEYLVKHSQGHYRSLSHVLPSVLMKSMAMYATENKKSILMVQQQSSESLCESIGGSNHGFNTTGSKESFQYHDYRVLIAEDNRINQKVLARMLARMGIEHVVIVDDGQKAVQAEAAEPFDVVLMDMQMPVMDGIEACRRICARRHHSRCGRKRDEGKQEEQEQMAQNIPQQEQEQQQQQLRDHPVAMVVFVTAHVSPSFEAQCEQAGGSGFCPKPYNIQDIEECFDKVRFLKRQQQLHQEEQQGNGNEELENDDSFLCQKTAAVHADYAGATVDANEVCGAPVTICSCQGDILSRQSSSVPDMESSATDSGYCSIESSSTDSGYYSIED